MIPRFTNSSPLHSPTPIAQYDVPYEPRLLSGAAASPSPSNLTAGDVHSRYSLLHAAHRDLQKKYDALQAENDMLSQRLEVTMVVPSSQQQQQQQQQSNSATIMATAAVADRIQNHINGDNDDDDDDVTPVAAEQLVYDLITCSRELYQQCVWQDVEIIRSQPDYVQDYFCFFRDDVSCKAGAFVICDDYVCFVYSEAGRTSLVLPIISVSRVSVSVLPLGAAAASMLTYQYESTLCMDVTVNEKRHFLFFGFDDIEAVILSLQCKASVSRQHRQHQQHRQQQQQQVDEERDKERVTTTTRAPKDHREMYRREVLEVEKELWTRITQSVSWPVVYEKDGIVVSSFTPRDTPVIYRVTAVVDALPREVWSAYYDLDQRCEWDPILQPCSRVVDKIDDCTDVVYSCVSGAARGLVSARDYIDVRRWIPQIDGQSILLVYRGVGYYPGVETNPDRVRGQNHTCGVLFQPVSLHSGAPSCKIIMITQTQANGWIPQPVVDKATLKFVHELPERLREYIARRTTDATDN